MSGDEVTFHILYPENKVVTASRILLWYNDARENGELDADAPEDADAFEAARYLEDAGLITISNERPHHG